MMNNKTGECFYHVIRDGALRMTVRGSELKSTDIVESVDEPDSLYKLEMDIDRWLDKWPGLSVRVADLQAEITGWLDRRAAIAESECAWRWQSIADARDRAELERDDAFELISDLQEQVDEMTLDKAADALAKFGYVKVVRCRDCEHATISTLGLCKYCEMWVLPDVDGYGCDSQVNLPLDFFCAYGKRKEGGDD